jgi:CCDC81-like prokaryotic HU domain 1/CCDC81-like prokaryotic HU domain 2/SPOR domain
MNVDKHISDLLYLHDCVIVPEWGGFVANYAPAKVHPTQHSFTPPSKKIVFNANLKNNDGLLANHIATLEHTNYPEALKHIQQFVASVNVQLKNGAKVKMDELGTLYFDVERNIQFEPATTNYLLDAFGLSEFQSPAIKHGTITKRIEKEFNDRKAVPLARKNTHLKRYIALAIIAPLIFAMIWIPLKTNLITNFNYSTLNPFASKEVKPVEVKQPVIVAKKLPVENTDTTVVKPVIVNTLPTATTLVEPVKADTTAVATNVNTDLNFKFHLVAGCFQVEENAVKFVATLLQQNIDAAIIGKNNKGLYVVSCGNFASRIQALNQLNTLRKLQPNAWLYRN